MNHFERRQLIGPPIDSEWDWKVRLLWLLEDLISKVEALADRTPDFRTKDDCTIAPETHREGTCFKCGAILTPKGACLACGGDIYGEVCRTEIRKVEPDHGEQ